MHFVALDGLILGINPLLERHDRIRTLENVHLSLDHQYLKLLKFRA